MKTSTYKVWKSGIFLLFFPLMMGCSVLSGGNNFSDNPQIAEQQQQIKLLKEELQEAERYAEEAKQREKAAKSRLKAAEHELKALEEEQKRRNSY